LIPDGENTVVRLRHRGLPDDAIQDHEQGWDHYLGRLAVAAAGGDAGPDTDRADHVEPARRATPKVASGRVSAKRCNRARVSSV
jgi:hypothetical protein